MRLFRGLGKINGQLAEITQQMSYISNGAPAAVFATTTALAADVTANTTDGKKKAYVVTADGKWYYWNGTAWTAGGVYQATTLADKSVILKQVKFGKKTRNFVNNDKDTWKQGKYNTTETIKICSGRVDGLQKNTTYICQYDRSLIGATYAHLRLFDSAGNQVTSPKNMYYGTPFTITVDFAYAMVELANNDAVTAEILLDTVFNAGGPKVQIEAGSTMTDYIDWYELDIQDKTIGEDALQNECVTPEKIQVNMLKALRTGSKPDWKMVIVSDIHATSDQLVPASIRMPHMVNALNHEDELGKIDFVFFNGDLVTNTTGNDHIPNLKTNYLSKLRMPYYAVPGNHELATEANWISNFGYGKNYILSCNGIDLVCVDAFTNTSVASPDIYGWGEADISTDFTNAALDYLTNSNNPNAILIGHYLYGYTNMAALLAHEKVLCGLIGHIHDEVDQSLNGKALYRDGHYSFHVTHDMPWAYRVIQSVSGKISTYIVHPAASYPTIDYTNMAGMESYGLIPAWTQEYETLTPTVLKEGYSIKVMYP